MRILSIALFALTIVPLFAQSPKSTGTVTATAAEFRIPLPPSANAVWTWNRSDTPDNAGEYAWTVTARQGGGAQYSFGFYLYKFPGAREARGQIQDLLKAGQASVFAENAAGNGALLPNARVTVTVEHAAIVVRITNPDLVRLIFRDRPETVAIHTRTPNADYQIVRVTYRD